MKVLENKQTEITANAGEGKVTKLTYAELINLVCNSPIQGGYSIQDIKARIAILATVTNAGEELNIENADAAYLQNIVKGMKWSFVHKDLISFKEDVEKMQEVKQKVVVSKNDKKEALPVED